MSKIYYFLAVISLVCISCTKNESQISQTEEQKVNIRPEIEKPSPEETIHFQKERIRNGALIYQGDNPLITNVEEFLSIYTEEELQEVTQLHIGMNKIEKISGLERLPNLEDLVINMNNISDISGIYIPPKLSYISIGRNPISDISYLFDYPQFEGINIEHTNVSSLEGIEKLQDLKSLIMTNAKIEDFSPLLKLTKLEYILVRFNPSNQMDSSEFREKVMESNPNLEPFEH